MKILVADDEPEIRELIALFLESHFNATIVEVSSGNEAIAALKAHPDIDCVVSDYSMKDGSGGDLFTYIRSEGLKIPFFLCTAYDQRQLLSVFPVTEVSGFMLKPNILKPLQAAIESLNLEEGPAVAEAGVEFSPIRISSVAKVGTIPFDLYIMLSKGKFVKLSRSGDYFSQEDLEKYQAKHVDFLYLKRGDITGLMAALNARMEKLCEESLLSDQEISEYAASAIEMINALDPIVRFPDEAKQLIRTSAKMAMRTIHLNRRLDEIFRDLFANPNLRYLPSHSVAVASLACGIAGLLGWTSETTFYKLTLASFLHDITLKSDELASFQTLSELMLNADRFSQSDIDSFMRHPQDAANLLNQIKEIPPDIQPVVLQHHERPDGTGFPNRIDYQKIGPLSAVMILAHELYRYYRETGVSGGLAGFIDALGPSFRKGTFGQAISAMLKYERRPPPGAKGPWPA